MRVAPDLDGDIAARPAEFGEVLALGRLVEPPPDMQLGRAFGRPAAAFDHQRRVAKMPDQVIEFGGDVAGVEINHDGLHLQERRRLWPGRSRRRCRG